MQYNENSIPISKKIHIPPPSPKTERSQVTAENRKRKVKVKFVIFEFGMEKAEPKISNAKVKL